MTKHLLPPSKQHLVKLTSSGLYCPQGRFYIDPWRPVQKAVITHAHADHAYPGHRHYLTHVDGIPLLQYRLGNPRSHFHGLKYGETLFINGVKLSLHPAGHVLGSSQIRLETKEQVLVISGDYKLEADGISAPFEPVSCDVFMTESTFGLPCFQWEEQKDIFSEINTWWQDNRSQGLTSILVGYSLGKAQRLLKGIDPSIGPLFAHGAVWNLTDIMRKQSACLFPSLEKVSSEISRENFKGGLVLAPPSAIKSPWMNRFQPYRIGYASGWMALRGMRRRLGVDRGFILSDHADWMGLQKAIQATGARRIMVTHGFTSPFSRWLQEKGYEAEEVETVYGDEEEKEQNLL